MRKRTGVAATHARVVVCSVLAVLATAGAAWGAHSHQPTPGIKQTQKLKLVNKWQNTSIRRTDKGFQWAKVEGRFQTLWRKGNPPKNHLNYWEQLRIRHRYSLPPAYISYCESRNDPRALNPSSGASGKWQFLDSTWQAMGGTGKAMHASVAEQDYRAAKLYTTVGASQWVCS